MNPLYEIDKLPTTSGEALREFDDRYIAGAGAGPVPSWATDLGDFVPTNAPMLTFPISALGLKFQKSSGQNRFKDMSEKSFDVKAEEFDEGIIAKLKDILEQIYAYRKWLNGPERLKIAEARFRNRQIATLLEAGVSTACWDGVNFFSATHPRNFAKPSLGTFSNYQATTKSVLVIENILAEIEAYEANAFDETGELVDSTVDTIIVHRSKRLRLLAELGKEFIREDNGTNDVMVSNPLFSGVPKGNGQKGLLTVVSPPELSNTEDWCVMDAAGAKADHLPPWLSIRQTVAASLEMREYNEDSELFRDSGRIAKSAHVWCGFALAMPHRIRLVKGA